MAKFVKIEFQNSKLLIIENLKKPVYFLTSEKIIIFSPMLNFAENIFTIRKVI